MKCYSCQSYSLRNVEHIPRRNIDYVRSLIFYDSRSRLRLEEFLKGTVFRHGQPGSPWLGRECSTGHSSLGGARGPATGSGRRLCRSGTGGSEVQAAGACPSFGLRLHYEEVVEFVCTFGAQAPASPPCDERSQGVAAGFHCQRRKAENSEHDHRRGPRP